jgi:hypothetical protein
MSRLSMRTLLVAAWLCVLSSAVPAAGQPQLTDPELRAAFLFNFARFTTWPGAAQPSPVVICTDDATVLAALTQALDGKSIDGRPVTSRSWPSTGTAGCHIAYLRHVRGADLKRLAPQLSASSVLSVIDDRALLGTAVAQFFIQERKLRFAISLPAVDRSGLQMSSRLLALAEVVR